jgi:hypothetical protein
VTDGVASDLLVTKRFDAEVAAWAEVVAMARAAG